MSRPQTLTEKILSGKIGRETLQPEEFYLVPVDVALANDITGPVAVDEFFMAGGERVFQPERVFFVADHFTPNKDIRTAQQVKKLRDFARRQNINHFYDVGRMGIEHVLLPEQGWVKAGDLVVGADSHTCTYGALGAFACGVGSTDIAGVFLCGKAWLMVPHTIRIVLKGEFRDDVTAKDLILYLISLLGVDGANYRALEFAGEGVASLSMEGRLTVSNMAVECGAKTGLFPVDERTIAFLRERNIDTDLFHADDGALYERTFDIDLENLNAQVAFPHLPSNCRDVDEAEKEKIRIDQVVIGSCTNGRMEDLQSAAAILKGKKVGKNIRCIIIPGSQAVYLQAVRDGILETFVEAGCAVSTPTCGPCLGGHMGILAAGERACATTNRNFIGRMGHPESEVYLASPATAAATAVAGYLCGPRHL